jgi:hypothetical protein
LNRERLHESCGGRPKFTAIVSVVGQTNEDVVIVVKKKEMTNYYGIL